MKSTKVKRLKVTGWREGVKKYQTEWGREDSFFYEKKVKCGIKRNNPTERVSVQFGRLFCNLSSALSQFRHESGIKNPMKRENAPDFKNSTGIFDVIV